MVGNGAQRRILDRTYAASADYERRLSEVDCVSELEPDTAEEPPRDVG